MVTKPGGPAKTSQPKHPSGVCLVGDYISKMRGRGNICNWALAGLTLCACAATRAVTPDSPPNQYKSITNRNLFALNPAPPPAKVEPPAPVLPKITLTGITTILGRNLAIMKALFPGAAGQPAKEQSYMLAEGQRDGDLEVLEVDDHAGTVKVKNFGTVMTLTFEKEMPKPAAPAPGAQLNATGTVPVAASISTNPLTPTGNYNTGKRIFPVRTPPLPSSGGAIASPVTNINPATASPLASPTVLTNPPPQIPGQEKPLTPEEQIALKELEREAAKEQLENGAVPGTPASALPPAAPQQPATGLAPQ
ncbi:MAG: hypothetical protein QOJ40_1621 [Verrucomicrobiota bacterium]